MVFRIKGIALCALVFLVGRLNAHSGSVLPCLAPVIALGTLAAHSASEYVVVSKAKPLRPENDRYVRNILRAMGVVEVERVVVGHLDQKGDTSAYASTPLFVAGPRYVVIGDEAWFDSCDDAHKRFVIGHEAVHLARRHEVKMGALTIGAGLAALLGDSLLRSGLSCVPGAQDHLLGASRAGFVGSVVFSTLLAMRFSRYIEREADTVAARELDAAAGGVADMQEFKQEIDEKVANLSWWQRALHFCLAPFRSHPSCNERIAYLQKVAVEQRGQR